ncbi:hypothetical protein TKK_0010680 [Trichogramma kaykai]|uniref:Peptidase S1 domain-containing protein n=1 Tax=Trichogramma kaykai TaxID=54128 RepID=A0ABD2WWY6_9HYME
MLKKSLISSFLGLFLIIAVSNAYELKEVGVQLEGGHIAEPGRFKHHVSIQILSLKDGCTYHACEGAILDERHIITTAYCVADNANESLVVVAGALDLRDKKAGLYHEVEYTYVPKTYRFVLHGLDDIAILKLKKPLPLGTDSRIQAVKLPTADYSIEKGPSFVMSGYGFKEQHANRTLKWSYPSPVLRFDVQWNPFNDKQCNANNKEFCTRLNAQFNWTTCNMYDGAPLVDGKYDSNNQLVFTLIGVFKYMDPHWCGSYTKHTKVSAYLDFISNVRNLVLNDVKSEKLPTDDYPNKLRRYPQCKL